MRPSGWQWLYQYLGMSLSLWLPDLEVGEMMGSPGLLLPFYGWKGLVNNNYGNLWLRVDEISSNYVCNQSLDDIRRMYKKIRRVTRFIKYINS
jgi:hypothetical protein